MDLKDSWPAVSHIWSFICLASMLTILAPNSTPKNGEGRRGGEGERWGEIGVGGALEITTYLLSSHGPAENVYL